MNLPDYRFQDAAKNPRFGQRAAARLQRVMAEVRRARRSDVAEADEMALDFRLGRDEWINRLVCLGGLTPGDAERHARSVETRHGPRSQGRAGAARGYRLAQPRITGAM
jgi:hypothetical protein